jgi:putative YpdA family bacillithiol system oxidoreductase
MSLKGLALMKRTASVLDFLAPIGRSFISGPLSSDISEPVGNTARILVSDLFGLLRLRPAFAELDDTILRLLISEASVLDLEPNELFKGARGESAASRIYFVVDGQIGVVRERALGIESKTPKAHLPNPGREYVLHLSNNDFFSGEFLRTVSDGADRSIQCIAIMRSTLMSVPSKTVHDAMNFAPHWAEKVRDRGEDLRKFYRKHRTGDLRVIQNFYLQHNFSYAKTLKVIDLDRCIGCDGCERACADRHGVARLQRKGPALGRLSFAISCRTCIDHRCFHACGFEAISVIDHGEVKFDSQKCVGCAACYSACPNGVITMQEKPYVGSDFKEKLPQTDLDGRTNVPGLYLTGEASGTALIKLAINSGRKAIECIASELGQPAAGGEILDVIVVGAGPAGLSAALAAKELGLHFRVFDKGHFATTIQNYPRNKVVMAEPMHVPLYGNLWLKDTTKEELIEQWRDIIEKTGLEIHSNEPVQDVKKAEDGAFDVATERGRYRARAVVLATGTRGSPRKLGVPGEAEPRVRYQLTEPEEMRGKHVLIVGGGDSAVEAAMSCADAPGTTVTLSYRKDGFGRIKPRNKARLDEYASEGKVQVVLESEVKAIGAGDVMLKVKDEIRAIPNDFIFAMLGAEPPTKFFEKVGINIIEPGTPEMEAFARSRGNRRYSSKCDHCTGYSDQACIAACPTNAIIEITPEDVFAPISPESGKRVPFSVAPFEDGIRSSSPVVWAARIGLIVALVSGVGLGLECFLRRVVPEWSFLYAWQMRQEEPIDVAFVSGAGLGYWLGIAGTALMFLTALYPLNSRLGLLRKVAKTQVWLSAHIIAGVLGPVFVTYHTTLKLNRWPSVAFYLVWAVVFTGAIGRHLVTFIRRAGGLADFEGVVADNERHMLVEELSGTSGHTKVINLLELDAYQARLKKPTILSAVIASLMLIGGEVTGFLQYLWLKHVKLAGVRNTVVRERALEVLRERLRHRRKSLIMDRIARSAFVWRWVHLFATIMMFGVAIAHVVAALLFKVS